MKVIYRYGYSPDREYKFISVEAVPDPSHEYVLKVERDGTVEELFFTHLRMENNVLIATLPENY